MFILAYVVRRLYCFAYDEVEPIPEEKPEEPGDQETAAADAYERKGKSHRSLMLTMIDPK